ncbi:hypothetical protein C8R45DRAFT_62900 [Mycena sanguinolenta]|nr:hypothetical protein C8R45DRAFT_62900 [Mycena sanguinolenta]
MSNLSWHTFVVLAYPIEDPISPSEAPWSDEEIFVQNGTEVVPRRKDEDALYTVTVFDSRSRRWYNIISDYKKPDNIEWSLDDPYWADILRQTDPRSKRSSEFNRIFVEKDGSLTLATVSLKEAGFETIYPLYPPPDDEHIPRISISELSARRWFWFSVDLAEWQGKEYVFKQIFFHEGAHELRTEVDLLLALRPSPFFPNIEAVIVDEHGMMRGILMPFLGHTIDAEQVATLSLSFFRDLFLAMSDLERLGKMPHGDLFARNILVSDEGRLTVIDLGNVCYDYPGDRQALCDLLVHADVLKKIASEADRKRVAWAGEKLQENWEYSAIAQGLQGIESDVETTV